MTVSLRLTDKDSELVKAYAELNGISVSELFRRSVFERIEDEHDLRAFEQAMADYRQDGISYSHEEVMRMFADE